MLKQWPADGSTVSFGDLVDPLRKVLRRGEYAGYDIGEREKAGCLSPDEALAPEQLDRYRERGTDRAAVVLGIAVQLGIEQGRRMAIQEAVREVERMIKWQKLGVAPDLEELLAALRHNREG